MNSTIELRYDWTVEEIEAIYALPLTELFYPYIAFFTTRKKCRAANCSASRLEAARKIAPTARNRHITTPTPGKDHGQVLLDKLGMRLRAASAD